MPTSQCSRSPALDDGIVAELFRGGAFALDRDARLEPGVEAEVGDALAPPPHQIARSRGPRLDQRRRKHRLGHRPDQLLHPPEERFLVWQPRRDQLERQRFGITEFAVHVSPSAALMPLSSPLAQAVREREHRGAVDRDGAGIPLLDQASAPAIARRPRARPAGRGRCCRPPAWSSGVLRRRRPASCRRARCAGRMTPPAAAGCRAGVEEHVDRPAPRREVSGAVIALNTGSSAYSRIGTTHMSMPCLRISAGRKVSSRSRSQRCCIAASSRWVPNGRTGRRRGACRAAGWASGATAQRRQERDSQPGDSFA